MQTAGLSRRTMIRAWGAREERRRAFTGGRRRAAPIDRGCRCEGLAPLTDAESSQSRLLLLRMVEPPTSAGAAYAAGYVYSDDDAAAALGEAEGYLEEITCDLHEGGCPAAVAASRPNGRRRPRRRELLGQATAPTPGRAGNCPG